MKRYISFISAAAIICALNANARSEIESNPGFFDFSDFLSVNSEDAKVEVNINKPLLKLATTLIREESPEAADLISGLQMVRVRVFTITDENRADFAMSFQRITEKLNDEQWDQLIRVKDGKSNVGIFARMPSEETISGLVISVMDAKEAVFVNIVGEIDLDAIADLGRHLGIPALKKLRKFQDSVEES